MKVMLFECLFYGRGRGRPSEHSRNVINDMLWQFRTGAP
jgi:hypothetical protein